DSGGVGIGGSPPLAVGGGPPGRKKRNGARYTSRPFASEPDEPPCTPPNAPASSLRGTDMTRVILPFGSITIIDIDCGSTKSVESPRNGMRLGSRPEYAVAVGAVVSAPVLVGTRAESIMR